MAYTAIAGTDTLSASRSVLNTGIQNAENNRSSGTAPTSPVAGVTWRDTTSGTVPLKMWSGASWITLFPDLGVAGGGLAALTGATFTGVVAGIAAASVSQFPIVSQIEASLYTFALDIGTISASADRYAWTIPSTKHRVNAVYIVSDTGVAANGANKWVFQVRNLTLAVDLCSVAKDTSAAAITADTRYTLGVDQNNGPGAATPPTAGNVIEVQMTKTGAPNALGASGQFLVVVEYKVALL